MIRVFIADDEPLARKRIRELLQNYHDFKVCGEAQDSGELAKLLKTKEADAAFVDINMPGKPVFDVINSINVMNRPGHRPFMIFQTAYSEYAVDAFEAQALDYLLKPVSRGRFKQTVEKLRRALFQTTKPEAADEKSRRSDLTQITVKSGDTFKVIAVKDLIAVTTEDGLCFLRTTEGEFHSDKPLFFYEEILSQSSFFRVSREALVNTSLADVIVAVTENSFALKLKNGDLFPVSRRRLKTLKQKLSTV